MKELFQNQRNFFVLTIAWVLGGALLLFTKSSIEWHESFIGAHNQLGDFFFKYTTYFGDGIFVVVVGLLLALYSMRASILVLSSYIVSGIIVQILKRVVFAEMHRPVYVFAQMGIDLHQVEGVVVKNHLSFPSGHTASAFALFFSLSLIFAFGRPFRQAILFLGAVIVATSRIYLNLHFFVDVYYGAIIGIAITGMLYFAYKNVNKQWYDKPIISLF